MNLKTMIKFAAICAIPVLLIAAIFCFARQPALATSADVQFQVHPQYNLVYATGWDEGVAVTLTVTNGEGDILALITTTVGILPWDPPIPGADFSFTGFDFQPGQFLTAEGDVMTRTFLVPDPMVTEIDVIADTIRGTGNPGETMLVCANPDFYRWTTIDPGGSWMVDFTTASDPRDTPGSRDLVAGSNGWADEISAQGDQTWADDWHAPKPSIYAHVNENRVDVIEFPGEETLEMTIQGSDVYTTMNGVTDPTGYANFDLGWSFTLEPAQVITVTDDTITKTLTVMDLYVDLFDPLANQVSGHSDPDVEVGVNVWIDNGIQAVQADATGSWTASYDTSAGPWFPTTQGQATSSDTDGDTTVYRFNTGNIFAWIPSTVELQNPTNYRDYTITIDDPTNGPGVDYTDTQPVEKPGEQTVVTFNLVGFYIKAGDLITVTAGHDIRSLVIAPQGEISFDVVHDIISGVNLPDSWVYNVDALSWREAKTDVNGAWSIDYSMPGPNGQPVEDITYGMSGYLFQLDADGDFTPFGWRILAYTYMPSVNR